MKVIFMENKTVIYIDYLDSYLDVLGDRFPVLIRRLVYMFLHFWGYVKADGNRLKLYCVEMDEISPRMINNLKEKLLLMDSKDVILPNLLLGNSAFVNILEEYGYKILRGKWLYKFLCFDIVQKIACVQGKDIGDIEVSVLSNEDSEINIENIKLLAEKCKVVNVITKNPRVFRVVERYLYDEFGSIINVSTNKSKSCQYSDVILNFDFNINDLKKCKTKKQTVIVQFNKEKFENNNGVTIVFYKLNLPRKYLNVFEEYAQYNEEILYESLLYYKTSFENVREILKRDNVSIRYFQGCNGKLQFNEIKNLS